MESIICKYDYKIYEELKKNLKIIEESLNRANEAKERIDKKLVRISKKTV